MPEKYLMLLNPARPRARTHKRAVKAHKRRHRRRKNPANPIKRRGRHRRGKGRFSVRHVVMRRNPVGKDITSTFGDLVSKDTLTVAGGAVLGGLAASWVMSVWGPLKFDATTKTYVPKTADEFKLPGSGYPWGALAYGVGIPVLGAVAVRRFNPNLSRGMLYGGAVLLIQGLLNVVQGQTGFTITPPTSGTHAYLNPQRMRSLPNGIAPVRGMSGPLDNTSAFRPAWAGAR